MSTKNADKCASIYQIKVCLRGSNPLVWRRICVASDTHLTKLHKILQAVMGWHGRHLHEFYSHGVRYAPAKVAKELECQSERSVVLADLVNGKPEPIVYEYDMGDAWFHTLTVEKTTPPEKDTRYPCCVEGKNACPPEDCGGLPGYYEKLEALKDARHPDHQEVRDWMPAGFDPKTFDLEKINRELRKIR